MRKECCDLLDSLAIPYTERDIENFFWFLDELYKWNKRMNLVGKNSIQEIYTHLLCDSFYLAHLLREYPLQNSSIIDLGAGAGIPGIPLRIFWQEGIYSMVERRQKRVLFMEHVLSNLKLTETKILYQDADDFIMKEKEYSDLILSRAFMPPEKLLTYCYTAIKKNGLLVLMTKERVVNIPLYVMDREYSYTVAGDKRYITFLRVVSS